MTSGLAPEVAKSVSYSSTRGQVNALLATPSTQPPWSGVVVVHDILGMACDVEAYADRFAREGYLALAPDLYTDGGFLRCVWATFQSYRRRSGRAFDDIDAARAWLAGRQDCNRKIAIIGFCLGGGFALLMAAGRQFQVSAVNYGEVPADAKQVFKGACPIVASYGARDPYNKGEDLTRLRAALAAAGVANDFPEPYPGSGHSFMNDYGPLNRYGPLAAVIRVIGFGYDPSASQHAWRRILAFFDRYLR